MRKPSGGILYAAWILVIIGAILQIVIGALSLVGHGFSIIPGIPGWGPGTLIGAIVSIVIGIIILATRLAERLDEWVWIVLAIILAIIAFNIGGLLVLIGAILAIIAKIT